MHINIRVIKLIIVATPNGRRKNISCPLSLSHLIYPLTARVVGAPQMISQSVSSIFPCSPLPSWTWQTPGLSIPECCLPTSSFVCLVFFPLSLCLCKMVLARPDEQETCPYHCSLSLFTGSWDGLPRW